MKLSSSEANPKLRAGVDGITAEVFFVAALVLRQALPPLSLFFFCFFLRVSRAWGRGFGFQVFVFRVFSSSFQLLEGTRSTCSGRVPK